VLDGKKVRLDGHGNMNHDNGVLFPAYTPWNWQVFWFFNEDHALAVTDFYTHREFGVKPVLRLVFADKTGRQFTSTQFTLNWDDWEQAPDIPFRYPRHFTFSAAAGGARLEGEVQATETLLREDLYSNLPAMLLFIAKRITPNGWTYDAWSDYTLTYTEGGQTTKYRGRGVARWTSLEETKK